jgi:hypothetical protein
MQNTFTQKFLIGLIDYLKIITMYLRVLPSCELTEKISSISSIDESLKIGFTELADKL